MANDSTPNALGWTSDELGSAESGLHSPTYKEKLRTSAAKLELDFDNTEAWHTLLNCVYKLEVHLSRPFYDAFLKRFPTAAYHWNVYAQRELKHGNIDRVKRIFQQCLLNCPYVQLWETYLSFLKKQGTPAAEMASAYEFAIDHVGYDIGSSSIWQVNDRKRGGVMLTLTTVCVLSFEVCTGLLQLFERICREPHPTGPVYH